jgi:hypothetical protein
MNKKIFVFSVAALVLSIILAGCQTLSNIGDTGNNFMTSLKNQDYASSFTLLTPDLQAELGGVDGWQSFAEPRNFSEWTFTNNKVENDSGQLDGEATLGNEVYTISLVMQKVKDEWKVAGIDISFKENK